MKRLVELHIALQKCENEISAWCMRMAWPGGTPTPPFRAWETRSKIYEELRSIGVQKPKYFNRKPMPDCKISNTEAARIWWKANMPDTEFISACTKSDNRVDVYWSDNEESGSYTLPIDFMFNI